MPEDHEVLHDDHDDEPYLPEDDESDGELESRFPMPAMQMTLDKAIVVDGLPQVPTEKYDKLFKVVEKIFTQIGPLGEDGIMMPKDPATGLSKGCVAQAIGAGVEWAPARAGRSGARVRTRVRVCAAWERVSRAARARGCVHVGE
jgi:hypothetical protein